MKKSYTINIPVRTFWTVILPLGFLLMLVGGVAGMFIVDRVVMPNMAGVNNRGVVNVPSIITLSYEDARQRLYDIGLRLQVQAHEYNDTLSKGIIISQRPDPHVEVKKGRHIFVVVSEGAEVAKIPDVRSMSEGIGKKVLREAGFGAIKVVKSYSEKIEKDLIVISDPPRGTVTSREVPVEITISKGPRPTHALVPNVIGEILSDAKSMIEESGLYVGKIQYRTQPKARPGAVISQSVSPGTNAPLESKIDLVVSASL